MIGRTAILLGLAACSAHYDGLWQSTDRSVTLSLETGHVARWSVTVAGPNTPKDGVSGYSERWEGTYEELAHGVELHLRCGTIYDAGASIGCRHDVIDVRCDDGSGLRCTFDSVPHDLVRAVDERR